MSSYVNCHHVILLWLAPWMNVPLSSCIDYHHGGRLSPGLIFSRDFLLVMSSRTNFYLGLTSPVPSDGDEMVYWVLPVLLVIQCWPSPSHIGLTVSLSSRAIILWLPHYHPELTFQSDCFSLSMYDWPAIPCHTGLAFSRVDCLKSCLFLGLTVSRIDYLQGWLSPYHLVNCLHAIQDCFLDNQGSVKKITFKHRLPQFIGIECYTENKCNIRVVHQSMWITE